MNNPRPQAQKLALKWRCIGGEDLGTRRTKTNEIGLSWNRPISPTIQGRMKEAEYSMMSRGRTSGMPRSSVALLSGRGSLPLRSRGSRPSLGEVFDLVMSMKSLGRGRGPMDPH
jgi:hypothetical protein